MRVISGTVHDETPNQKHWGLREIARAQQARVNGEAQRPIDTNTVIGRHEWPKLRQGKYSFDSNPTSPPWVTMPDGGFPFSANGTINTPASPSAWTDVIGPNGQYPMQVPYGNDGVIKTLVCFYNGAGFVSGSGALLWRILVDGQAVRNYDNILVQLGVPPFPGDTEGIRIKSDQTVQFQVQNVSVIGAATQIFCFFGGWYYPNKLS